MIEIDGSRGEGGGQVLRSALTLAMVTGQATRITNIRAGRRQPGLRAQHLTAVRAAAAISGAFVDGACPGSAELVFQPGLTVQPGQYRFDIGTAGSTSLILQTLSLPLALAAEASEVTLIGGTHVPWSPSYHYLELQWLPYARRMGLEVELELLLAGFYPQGNGEVRAHIEPSSGIAPLQLHERGALKRICGISAVANLDLSIAERQRDQALRRLRGRHRTIEVELLELPARTKGTFLLLMAEFKYTSACYVALGALGKRAEQVADETCLGLERFLAGSGAIDEYLADQILLPLAFAVGQSEYRTARVTQHLLTNADVIRAFTHAEIEIAGDLGEPGRVQVKPGDSAL